MKKTLMAALILAVGCGADPETATVPVVPPVVVPPVTLESIAVDPAYVNLGIGETAQLQIVGTYSDGTTAVIDGAWSVADDAIASLAHPQGAINVATALLEGTTTVTAEVGVHQSTSGIEVGWNLPADPGPVYAHEGRSRSVLRYASAGAARSTIITGATDGRGIALAPDQSALFVLHYSSDLVNPLMRYDLVTGAYTQVGVFAGDRPFGLDMDSQGRIYTAMYEVPGTIVRYDPVANLVENVCDSYQALDIAFSVTDQLFLAPAWSGGVRRLRDDGEIVMYSRSMGGMSMPCGLAINRRNEVFTGDITNPSIAKDVDLNGDGDALDLGERVLFATLPGAEGSHFLEGLCTTKGPAILVNVQPWMSTPGGLPGIYWLADRDGDGVAESEGEVTLFSAEWYDNGWTGSSLVAPK